MQQGAGGAAVWMFFGKFAEGVDIAPGIHSSQGVEKKKEHLLTRKAE